MIYQVMVGVPIMNLHHSKLTVISNFTNKYFDFIENCLSEKSHFCLFTFVSPDYLKKS